MGRTSLWRVIAWVLAVIAAFALGVLLTRLLTSSPTVGLEGTGGDITGDGQTFTVSGDLSEPMSPGVLVPLDLSLSNTHDEPLLVSGLVVTVESVDAPHATPALPCGIDDFVVAQVETEAVWRVDPGETRTLAQLDVPESDWPRVGMVDADENQDGCKAATVELSYTATGRFDS